MNRHLASAALALALAAGVLTGCNNGPPLDSATGMNLSTPPAQLTAGETFGLTATIRDAQNATVTQYEGNVTVSVSTGPGTLEGTTTVKATKGVATFAGLVLKKAGEYVLAVQADPAGSKSIPPGQTAKITVVAAAAAALGMVTQPGDLAPGGISYPAPQVGVVDAYGNVVTAATTTITAALGNNPSGSVLSGVTTAGSVNAVATFDDLSLDKLGSGYTLVFSAPGITSVTSAPFDVANGRLVYTDPVGGDVQLIRDAAASTDTTVVLNLVATSGFTGYMVGLNLPVDPRVARANSSLFTLGSGLNPGAAPAAAGAALPTTGKLAGVLTAGVSQKAAGAGAVTTDTTVAPGTVLFTIRLDLAPVPLFGAAFDGATPSPQFQGAVRTRDGNDVVPPSAFGIGRLVVSK